MSATESTPRVLVAGETLVDLVAADASLATAEAFDARVGGAPANVAAGLAALEEPAALWTRVGDDGLGDRCRRALDAAGVPGEFVEVDPDRETTVAFATRETAADDLAFSFYRRADRHLGEHGTESRGESDGPAKYPVAALDDVSLVVVGGIALASDPAQSGILDLVDAAADADCTVVFDPNARPTAWAAGEFERTVERVLQIADVVKATPADLAAAGFDVDAFTPGEDARPASPDAAPALAREVCERGPHTTFLTLGSDGAAAASTHRSPFGRGGATHCGYDVETVDPTGAGDAFLAAVVAELAGGATDPYAVLDVATAAGALATTTRGAMPALPDRASVDALVASDGGAP
ncbi:carbohydrate kinase [Halorubellus sp. JP-L1]|uniref:carbohydrate kinase family protein n=1 Tax=Halorubellus sp. JP-L1 TaxID=2715753 RepID=UPI001409C910|nr:PfkB family carbohydrate kinase [Halorubellus sp. JP-L1]NHN42506.1 carbohydrate kinase [Halorubellus sp. JP-L1]